MKKKRIFKTRKQKHKPRGTSLAVESWFTEKRTPINRGRVYQAFNSGNPQKGKSEPKALGRETLPATGRRANFSHKCGRCRNKVEILFSVPGFSRRICRTCCNFPYSAGSVKNRSLNEVQRRKARDNKREREANASNV